MTRVGDAREAARRAVRSGNGLAALRTLQQMLEADSDWGQGTPPGWNPLADQSMVGPSTGRALDPTITPPVAARPVGTWGTPPTGPLSPFVPVGRGEQDAGKMGEAGAEEQPAAGEISLAGSNIAEAGGAEAAMPFAQQLPAAAVQALYADAGGLLDPASGEEGLGLGGASAGPWQFQRPMGKQVVYDEAGGFLRYQGPGAASEPVPSAEQAGGGSLELAGSMGSLLGILLNDDSGQRDGLGSMNPPPPPAGGQRIQLPPYQPHLQNTAPAGGNLMRADGRQVLPQPQSRLGYTATPSPLRRASGGLGVSVGVRPRPGVRAALFPGIGVKRGLSPGGPAAVAGTYRAESAGGVYNSPGGASSGSTGGTDQLRKLQQKLRTVTEQSRRTGARLSRALAQLGEAEAEGDCSTARLQAQVRKLEEMAEKEAGFKAELLCLQQQLARADEEASAARSETAAALADLEATRHALAELQGQAFSLSTHLQAMVDQVVNSQSLAKAWCLRFSAMFMPVHAAEVLAEVVAEGKVLADPLRVRLLGSGQDVFVSSGQQVGNVMNPLLPHVYRAFRLPRTEGNRGQLRQGAGIVAGGAPRMEEDEEFRRVDWGCPITYEAAAGPASE